ncbi:MAG: polymer-forming cytoskeletal protein [Phycisphaeraceae bacterium]|nr:polymer-forming cytoskeletal protein [Phycisphaeraceae bacterium]
MSPLRPALSAFYLRRPRPKEVRKLCCPNCGEAIEVSQKAFSARCPRCTHPLSIKDFDLEQAIDGELSTMGQVRLGPECRMTGNIHCAQFTNQGQFRGKAVVYGPIEIEGHSLTKGELIGHSLLVRPGARMLAKVSVGPKASQARDCPPVQAKLTNVPLHPPPLKPTLRLRESPVAG